MSRARAITTVVSAVLLCAACAPGIIADGNGDSNDCPVPNLPGNPRLNENLCQFYVGTASFRQEQYGSASQAWQTVMATEPTTSPNAWLKWTAQSNYAYLLYYGLGEKTQKDRAVKLFREAVEHGVLEARTHLGFAYSDKTFSGYSLPIAYAWFTSYERRFAKDRRGEPDDMMHKTNKRLLANLKSKMTVEEISRGEILTEQYSQASNGR